MDWTAVTTLIVVAFLGFKEWKSGSKKISQEVITNYETLNKQQKDNIEECRGNLVGATKSMHEMENRFVGRISKLEGIVQEKDKSIALLMQTLGNRDPKLQDTLTDIKNFMQNMNSMTAARTNLLEKEHSQIIKKPQDTSSTSPVT